MSDWYYKIGEQVVGPMSADQLRALAAGGRLAASDPVANAKEGPWVPASRVKGLFAPASVEEEPKASGGAQPAQTPEHREGPPIPQPPVVMASGMSGGSSFVDAAGWRALSGTQPARSGGGGTRAGWICDPDGACCCRRAIA